MAAKKKIKFDPTKARVSTFDHKGTLLSEINGELKSDFYSGVEKMCYLSDDYCAFYKGKKMGIVNSDGEMISPAEWESIRNEGKVFKVSKKNKVTKDYSYGFINLKGEELFNPQDYTSVNDVHDDRIVMSDIDSGKLQCVYDTEGNLVIPPKFFRLGNFYNGVAVAAEEKGKVGLIDKDGNWVLPPEYSSISGFGNRLGDGVEKYSTIKKDGKYGLIDRECKIIVEPQYDDIQDIDDRNGLLLVIKEGENCGVVDGEGKIIIPAEYDDISISSNGNYIRLNKDYKYGLADLKGNILADNIKARNLSIDCGLIVEEGFDKTQVRKLDGTLVCEADQVKVFENIILVTDDRKLWGVVDHNGNTLLQKEWKHAHTFMHELDFSDGLLNLQKDEKTVYIDEKGEVKLTLDTLGWGFKDGFAITGTKGDRGIIDLTGKVVAEHLPLVINLGAGIFYTNNEDESAPKLLNAVSGATFDIPARVVGQSVSGLIRVQAPDLKYGVVSLHDGTVIVPPVYSNVLITPKAIWADLPKE